MPSWSARLLPNPQAFNNSSAAPTIPNPESSPVRREQGCILHEPALRSYSIQSPQPSPNASTSWSPSPLRSASRHNRSISHPFPSIFNSGKQEGSRGLETNTTALGPNDDGLGDLRYGEPGRSPSKGGHRTHPLPADKHLMTGRCMTCDSLVRWPKELKVFRCTICLMINDLKPVTLGPCFKSGNGNASSLQAETFPAPLTAEKGITLSPERSRSIINTCVTMYLQTRLDETTSPDVASVPYLPPLRMSDEALWKAGKSKDNDVRSQSLNEIPRLSRPFNLPMDISFIPGEDRGSGHGQSSTQVSQNAGIDVGDAPTLERLGPARKHKYLRASQTELHRVPNPKPPLPAPHGLADPEGANESLRQVKLDHAKSIFRPLEDYIITCFGSFDCINSSFSTLRPPLPARSASEGTRIALNDCLKNETSTTKQPSIFGLDAKTLLLGNFAENGSWWTGGRPQRNRSQRMDRSHDPTLYGQNPGRSVKTSNIQWVELDDFYQSIVKAGSSWESRWAHLSRTHNENKSRSGPTSGYINDPLQAIASDLAEARLHTQRTLLKVTETILKRPGRPLKSPEDCRFLLILLANPLLYSSSADHAPFQKSLADKRGEPGQHSGIIKRIFGLLANLPNECHYYLVAWFSRLSECYFRRLVDLVGSFVTYRLTRQHGRKRSDSHDPITELIPSFSGPGVATSAQLHAALGVAGTSRNADGKTRTVLYGEDWQLKAAARVMSLLFLANNNRVAKKARAASLTVSPGVANAARQRTHTIGQMLPTSDFYNTLLDYSDIIADFETWESRRGRFSFCQYPFFYSIWAKVHILEYDARRQMEVKAREAFFNSIMGRKAISQYLVLKIRRDCLVEDSLRGVSENVGSGQEDIKKSLKIEFLGEEGVDAGGLRKEWFLLLVREVFDPHHGMFSYDEDSHYCYFNPNCFETSDQFFFIGVVLGLAIYNSTILDVALPPFAFKKLLASAPTSNVPVIPSYGPQLGHTLEDLAEFRPALAHGLRQLLEFEGDVESTFCRDFVAETESYGQISHIPLCPNGETKPVTNTNRREFVNLYVHYLLDTAVARQYEPFKRGFYTVCGGNALSLFRPDEIELLVRGSDEPLDIFSLRAVAIHEHWGSVSPRETEPVVAWFWESFEAMGPQDQRKLLSFITGSDRIPAMGATNLIIKVMCLGDDCERFPIARTCFNIIGLYKYSSMGKLAAKLSRAISESEGFGLR